MLTPKHRINEESFQRIKSGMTYAEVEAILGAPPGDHRVDPDDESFVGGSLTNSPWLLCHNWIGEDLAICVHFYGPQWKVAEAKCYRIKSQQPYLERLRRSLWRHFGLRP
jgi:hypothetical protein